MVFAHRRAYARVYYSLIFTSFYFRHKLYIVFKNMPCELLEFSSHGVLFYFSFARISFCRHTGCQQLLQHSFGLDLLSNFGGLRSVAAFLASSFAISFSVRLISAFCGFSPSRRDLMSVFSSSIWATVLERPSSSIALSFCNFTICASKSVDAVTRFLLPLVLA